MFRMFQLLSDPAPVHLTRTTFAARIEAPSMSKNPLNPLATKEVKCYAFRREPRAIS